MNGGRRRRCARSRGCCGADKDHDVLAVGEELGPHLVDIEHERGVDALDIGLEVPVEGGDVLPRDDRQAVARRRSLVGEAMEVHVSPESLSRHLDLELVGHGCITIPPTHNSANAQFR